jgi:acetyl esterase
MTSPTPGTGCRTTPRLGLDPQRLAIGGDSAGGNLAAACCLLLRELGLPQPRHQLLLYPALDAGMGSDSYREYAMATTSAPN